MATIDNAYQYYLNTYRHTAVSRYDTHKKSELRSVYTRMLKVNKDSPLYKIKRSEDVPRFLIDIKENARHIKNVVASLSDGEGLENSFQKKVAVSSDDGIVTASYVGGSSDDSTLQNFDLEVRQLAAPQTNLGNFLKDQALDIPPGDYSFNLFTTANSYEFQYTVKKDDNNLSVLNKLSRLINNSRIELSAEVISDESGQSALKIASKQTGIRDEEDHLFDISPTTSSGSIQAMDILGFNQVSTPAVNSSFLINGKEHSSYANTFTINNMFELTLKGISPDNAPAKIGFKTSIDAVADNIQELVDAYNGFIQTGERYSTNQLGNQLLHDLKDVSRSYVNDLESVGMLIGETGAISIDRDLLSDALETDKPAETFSVLNAFKNSLLIKADNASINPIKYIDKTIVTYKRPGFNFISPYSSSLYAGLMLDHYC